MERKVFIEKLDRFKVDFDGKYTIWNESSNKNQKLSPKTSSSLSLREYIILERPNV